MRGRLDSLRHPGRTGFVLPLVILAALAMLFFVTFVTVMGSGYTRQVQHQDEVTRCRAIGEAVFARVLARIHQKPWNERFFAPAPFTEEDVAFLNGSYDLVVQDTPGRPAGSDMADVFVKASFGRVHRLFFWRFKHEFSILDAAGRAFPILFANLGATQESIDQTPGSYEETIRTILEERQENQAEAAKQAGMVLTSTSLQDTLGLLDVPAEQPVETAPRSFLPPTPPPVERPESPPMVVTAAQPFTLPAHPKVEVATGTRVAGWKPSAKSSPSGNGGWNARDTPLSSGSAARRKTAGGGRLRADNDGGGAGSDVTGEGANDLPRNQSKQAAHAGGSGGTSQPSSTGDNRVKDGTADPPPSGSNGWIQGGNPPLSEGAEVSSNLNTLPTTWEELVAP